MKSTIVFLKFICFILLFSGLLFNCQKADIKSEDPSNPVPPEPPVISGAVNADSISNRLQFFNAVQKQGTMPKGPKGSSLRTSIKDTLYVFDEIKIPVKFLHQDTTKNVSGVFIQIYPGTGASASCYFDVPELTNTEVSDTVSVIMIGIDLNGLETPQIFNVDIVPYDKNKQPIDLLSRPIKIDKPKNRPPYNNGSCGLVLATGERWLWEMSTIAGNGKADFYSAPEVVNGYKGVDIEGSCCNEKSKWPEFCVGELKHNRTLHFATYYQIAFETIAYAANGTFFRQTMEDSPIPLPAESDFCNNGSGKVQESLKHSTYEGNWKIQPTKFPPNVGPAFKKDSLSLSMAGTGGTGTGFGNPGGAIHQLDCELGALVLIQFGREGGGKDLVKLYRRLREGESIWLPLN